MALDHNEALKKPCMDSPEFSIVYKLRFQLHQLFRLQPPNSIGLLQRGGATLLPGPHFQTVMYYFTKTESVSEI